MSEQPEKESTSSTQAPAPCPRCGKTLARSSKFSVSALFQTDPGEGLSRWQEYCRCDAPALTDDDDLPFIKTESDDSGAFPASPNWAPPAQKEAAGGSSDSSPHSSAIETAPAAQNIHAVEASPLKLEASKLDIPGSSTYGAASNIAKPGDFWSSGEKHSHEVPASSQSPAVYGSPPAGYANVGLPSQASAASVSRTNLPQQSPSSQSYMIGARYEVESVLGKGSFGPTYRARDIATNKSLCLKMVSTPISKHRRIVKRIMQEVEKAKTLNHPNIVAIYDSDIDRSGRPFYVMDLIEPGSLKQVIRQEGFLDVPEVLEIFLDVCEALLYAHEHGLLHRDLKPSNILLSGSGTARRAKVSDFGIIKALPSVGSEAQEMTQSTDVFADPSCMSPEQCLGRRLDVRSDIYSLGCTMYEAIIGKKVFSGPNPLSVVVQHFKAAPRSFDSVMYNCDISPDVEAVVMKMLEKSPENRYQEISQVIDDLRQLKAHKKPTFAYQKKKGGVRNLMLPFGVKDESDSPEKMFDMVLNKRNVRERERERDRNWADNDPKPQIAKDINRLRHREHDIEPLPQAPFVRLLGDGQSPDKIIARSEPPQPPPEPNSDGPTGMTEPDPVWIKELKEKNRERDEVIRPGKIKLPLAPSHQTKVAPRSFADPCDAEIVTDSAKDEQRLLRKMAPVYRASDNCPENLESLGQVSISEESEPESVLDQWQQKAEDYDLEERTDWEDEQEIALRQAPAIVTVEQAKREIPDYLLQISNTNGIFSLPVMLAVITSVCIVIMMMQIGSLPR